MILSWPGEETSIVRCAGTASCSQLLAGTASQRAPRIEPSLVTRGQYSHRRNGLLLHLWRFSWKSQLELEGFPARYFGRSSICCWCSPSLRRNTYAESPCYGALPLVYCNRCPFSSVRTRHRPLSRLLVRSSQHIYVLASTNFCCLTHKPLQPATTRRRWIRQFRKK